MARHKKSTPAAPQSREDAHPAYIALMARLTAFQAELSAQAKSRPTVEVPTPTLAIAGDLMAQMARLMARAVEARGLPVLPDDRPASFSETTIAFTQARTAFETFGKREKLDKPLPDDSLNDFRNEVYRMLNIRIIEGIRAGYLVPTGSEFDEERRELSDQFRSLVDRLELVVDETAFPDLDEKPFPTASRRSGHHPSGSQA